jgi:hypothetical protein
MISLKGQILQELHTNIAKLLTLNPSRREAIALYLDQLARQNPAPSHSQGVADPAGGLRRWLEGPRSPAQAQALQIYFEELALLVLGQAILMKAWSDRGIRRLGQSDLGRLNWALSTALKPHVPLDREGWQLTRPNLYSWYNPNQVIQSELWATLESCTLDQDGPSLLTSLLGLTRQHPTDRGEGYDARFFKSLWETTSGVLPAQAGSSLIKRERILFTPTLREGSLVRTGPQPVSWIGMERSPFLLMVAELMQLFRGPAQPPVWAVGTGLEAHSRDQLSLSLGSPKPSLLSRIAEFESCDVSVVLEERAIRFQGRSVESSRLREQLEQFPQLKKLKSSGSSLGDFQALVALSKLRPGGVFWWAREEALSTDDGAELLGQLLEKGKLLCHWDFSGLEYSLPVSLPLFPKHLYLFAREPRMEERLSHRPGSVVLRGQIRSHVEVPFVLEDALSSMQRACQPRGQWQIHCQTSPTTQKDWIDRWPDPTDLGKVQKLEALRQNSVPLAALATIRPSPDGPKGWSIPEPLAGVWIKLENDDDGRRLVVQPLPRPGREARGSGFLILLPAESWCAPVAAFLRLPIVRDWLDQNAERKSDRWILGEQVVRWIPIPKGLVSRLEAGFTPGPGDGFERPERIRDLRASLEKASPETHLDLFLGAACAMAALDSGQSRLLGVVAADQTIRWGKLLEILPAAECTSLSMHPRLHCSGTLPPHVPIARVDRVKAPQPGIILATELGPYLKITSDQRLLLDMAWEQLQDVSHHTWSEVVKSVRLPRRTDVAEATAADLLRLHGEQSQRLKELSQLLSACSVF